MLRTHPHAYIILKLLSSRNCGLLHKRWEPGRSVILGRSSQHQVHRLDNKSANTRSRPAIPPPLTHVNHAVILPENFLSKCNLLAKIYWVKKRREEIKSFLRNSGYPTLYSNMPPLASPGQCDKQIGVNFILTSKMAYTVKCNRIPHGNQLSAYSLLHVQADYLVTSD
jgi:hypothetical protein